MATLLLTAAGTAIGNAALPAGISLLGASASGAALGQAAGGLIGSAIDQRLFGPGATVRQGPRLTALDVVSSNEGAPIPRLFGKMRIAGEIIWATRFTETANTETQSSGGKGGGPSVSTTNFTYSCSFAIGLCEGPITGVSRLWADGQPMDLTGVEWRLYKGDEAQPVDPLIALKTGDAPAYRGLAYIVFEDLPLEPYGNRVPQITVEVRRAPAPPPEHEDGPNLPALISGVAMSPGSGEFSLATQPVRRVLGEGSFASENLNNTLGQPDFMASLDQLEATCPNCRSVLLVVSWFGDDLRLGSCRLVPGTDQINKETEPLNWRVSGEGRSTAHEISRDAQGNAHFGGTPSDISVFQAIEELKRRGFEVIFYPFILMDIPPGNTLGDGLGQPVFPWRGRIASDADSSEEASDDVDAFFGHASTAEFGAWTGETIPYLGEDTHGLRRMILHYAHLCDAAGGVDAFIIGSELRGITRTRDGAGGYPAVAALRQLASDVRDILPGAQLSYAADWSEYANHRPDPDEEGGGADVIFHLDPLWADPNIDFIGIDNYLPLSDWRAGASHLDAQTATSIYDLDYLTAGIERGEHADWFYTDEGARVSQTRSTIEDTAHGEDWVFGVKRLREWWENAHHDRPEGLRSESPTAWVPRSKPIRFTELGCPAVDFGTNQPNVFFDPKSSESALPYFSRGARDDTIQRRYLQAMLAHWQGDEMVDASYVWTWDARPFPDFPLRGDVWSDGPNYEKGHWLTGRLDAAPLAEIVAELCAAAGETRIDVSRLHGLVDGYMIERTMSARDALSPLMLVFGFDAIESEGLIRFIPRGDAPVASLEEADLIAEGDAEPFALTRAQETDLPRAVRLGFIRADAEFRRGSVSASLEPTPSERVEESEQAIALSGGKAQAAANRWLAESHVARDDISFSVPLSLLALEPGDIVDITTGAGTHAYRIARASGTSERQIEAIRVDAALYEPVDTASEAPSLPAPTLATPITLEFLDLPLLTGGEDPSSPRIAAFAAPWPGAVTVLRSNGEDGYRPAVTLSQPAIMGRTLTTLRPSDPWRWSGTSLDIALAGGGLSTASRLDVLAGSNAAALRTASGEWEVIQFREAELIASLTYRLSTLLRGQAGTEHLIASIEPGTRFVFLDRALEPLPLGEDELGREFRWRYGPATRPFDDETYRTIDQSFRGIGHRPYAPVHLSAERTASGDILIRWMRRTRRGGDSFDMEPPLAEETERYRIEIRDETGLLRQFETDAPEAIYSDAQQSEDAAPDALTITVAQISAVFGPGPNAELTL